MIIFLTGKDDNKDPAHQPVSPLKTRTWDSSKIRTILARYAAIGKVFRCAYLPLSFKDR